MRNIFVIAVALIFAPLAHGQLVTLPTEVKCKQGEWVKIEPVKVDGGKLAWRVDPALSEASLGDLLTEDATSKLKIVGIDPAKLFPADVLTKIPGKVFDIKLATPPGKYRVECWTAKGDVASEIATCWVIVAECKPPMPPPPPIPPTPPTPPVPLPSDPLVAKLQLAYTSDPAIAVVKATQVKVMIGLYQAMAVFAADPTITTTGKLLESYQKTATAMIMPGMLIEMRKVISAEVNATFGTDPSVLVAPMDDAQRARAVVLFKRLEVALGQVK